jgi:Fe-S cluster assembly protein SufD
LLTLNEEGQRAKRNGSSANPYLAEYERFDRTRTGREPAWLSAVRRAAIARFASLGFPTTRQEEWRFTNVSPLADRRFALGLEDAAALLPQDLDSARLSLRRIGVPELVFVNGRFAPGLSAAAPLPRGIVVRSLADVIGSDSRPLAGHISQGLGTDGVFRSLNTAFLSDGAFIEVAANQVVDRPVHLLFVSTPTQSDVPVASYPRVFVSVGANSQLRVIESYAGGLGPSGSGAGPAGTAGSMAFTNAVTDLLLGEDSNVDHYRLQREGPQVSHISSVEVRMARGANLSSQTFTFDGGLVRNDVRVTLEGEGGDCTLNGLCLAGGTCLVDNHTFIDHARPHCSSRELYKGILRDRARGVFSGKILVRPDAQKTDARQTNKTLLLSDNAQIDTKPQLEIFANDVKCTHGATVGQLSREALFYLQARGIGRDEAEQILIRAFAGDVTDRVGLEPLRDHVQELLAETLKNGGGAFGSPGPGDARDEAGASERTFELEGQA